MSITDPNLEVRSRTELGASVLSIEGDIDLASSQMLLSQMLREGTAAAKTVVADLSEVSFLDSSGLGALVTAHERIRDSGGELRLVIPVQNVRKVFEITGLTSVFSIYPTLSEALGR